MELTAPAGTCPRAADDCRYDPPSRFLELPPAVRSCADWIPVCTHRDIRPPDLPPRRRAGVRTTRRNLRRNSPGSRGHGMCAMPSCPVVLHGMTPAQAEAEHDRLVAEARREQAAASVLTPRPSTLRCTRSPDRPRSWTARTGSRTGCGGSPQAAWQRVRCVGGRGCRIYLHLDESPTLHPHPIGVSRGDLQCRADLLHDGRRAQAEARARGEDRRGRTCVSTPGAAMRAWQDEVYQKRLGRVRRLRLGTDLHLAGGASRARAGVPNSGR